MKDFHRLLAELRQRGHDVAHGRKHIKVTGTNGEIIYLPSTPGEGRALQNCRALARRKGMLP